MVEYKIKTKEVKPKVYSIFFSKKGSDLKILKMVIAYTFEDAVEACRNWIARGLDMPLPEAYKFEPSLYAMMKAESLVDVLVKGEENVVFDTNLLMKDILSKNKQEASDLFEKHKDSLSITSQEYLLEEINKKTS